MGADVKGASGTNSTRPITASEQVLKGTAVKGISYTVQINHKDEDERAVYEMKLSKGAWHAICDAAAKLGCSLEEFVPIALQAAVNEANSDKKGRKANG